MRPCSVNAISQRQAYLELCQLEGSKRIHRTLYVICFWPLLTIESKGGPVAAEPACKIPKIQFR
jgi:hypothetical protein